jgi:hypothetical protein
MWPFPKLNDQIVTVTLNPSALSCAWIQKNKQLARYELRAYQCTPLMNGEFANANLFNPTGIQRHINHFLTQHELTDACISMAVAGPHVTESVVELPTARPHIEQFPFPKLKKLVWEYRYLYPTDHNSFAFYVCGIAHHHLLQYQLSAIKNAHNLVAITSERMALLQLYKYIQGAAFRPAQLGKELALHNQDIHSLFTTDMLRRMLFVKPALSLHVETERSALLTNLGLFITQREINGTN